MIFNPNGKTKLCVANSPVHGKGLFTKDPIQEGDILGIVKGFRSQADGSYVLWVKEDHGVRMLCKFKYINHSDEPNVVLYDTLEVCALRDIARGEEIFHDYECGDWVEAEQ